jgi:hypothetical protein
MPVNTLLICPLILNNCPRNIFSSSFASLSWGGSWRFLMNKCRESRWMSDIMWSKSRLMRKLPNPFHLKQWLGTLIIIIVCSITREQNDIARDIESLDVFYTPSEFSSGSLISVTTERLFSYFFYFILIVHSSKIWLLLS